jgi:AraC-like DNA-binding protein
MEIKNLFEPFEIEYLEMKECPVTPHKHNFFELVYILEGTGMQCINKNKLPYAAEKLFLLMPQDCHSFEVKTVTKFFFIRFNDIYLKTQAKDWIQKLEFIFQNNTHLPGCIVKNKTDKPLVKAMVEALIREHINKQHYHLEVVKQIVNTLITIVARNISMNIPLKESVKTNASLEIINYIHQNIYSSEHLKAESIAQRFNISPTYISEYFKKLTGESLQQYIIDYKLKLIETRLQYSDLRMNEIAYELGFTDESHLTKTFKKYKGVSPSEFRKHFNNKMKVAAA